MSVCDLSLAQWVVWTTWWVSAPALGQLVVHTLDAENGDTVYPHVAAPSPMDMAHL